MQVVLSTRDGASLNRETRPLQELCLLLAVCRSLVEALCTSCHTTPGLCAVFLLLSWCYCSFGNDSHERAGRHTASLFFFSSFLGSSVNLQINITRSCSRRDDDDLWCSWRAVRATGRGIQAEGGGRLGTLTEAIGGEEDGRINVFLVVNGMSGRPVIARYPVRSPRSPLAACRRVLEQAAEPPVVLRVLHRSPLLLKS